MKKTRSIDLGFESRLDMKTRSIDLGFESRLDMCSKYHAYDIMAQHVSLCNSVKYKIPIDKKTVNVRLQLCFYISELLPIIETTQIL